MSYAEQFLRQRKRRHFETAYEFLEAASQYFKWCEDNPLIEEQINVWQGTVIRTDVARPRAFTKAGLATYLGIPYSRLALYKTKEDFSEVVEFIEQVLYTQKFEHAAVGLMNASIISRDLGLADKQEVTGKDGEPLQQVVQYQLPSNGRD